MRIHYNEDKIYADWIAGRERNVGDLVTLVYANDLNQDGKKPWYELRGADGAECNQAPWEKKHRGWIGTTSGIFRDAKGLFRIEKIEECKNGSEWIWLKEVSTEVDA